MNDMEAVKTFAKNYTEAEIEAAADFVEVLMSLGEITKTEAEIVLKNYIAYKIVKFDHMQRKYTVFHGTYLDKEIIKGAINA